MPNLPERLREARRRAGLRQVDLAAAIGEYDHTVISAIENGRSSMALNPLVRAADALRVSTDYLLGRTDEPRTARRGRQAHATGERLPLIDDVRLGRALAAIINHHERLNEYGRKTFLSDLEKHFPSLPWREERRRVEAPSAGT